VVTAHPRAPARRMTELIGEIEKRQTTGAFAMQTAARTLRHGLRVARSHAPSDALRFLRAAHAAGPYRDRWLCFLEDFARTRHLPAPSADLLMKPLNQYMTAGLSLAERIRLLRMHYGAMTAFAAPQVVRQLWSSGTFDAGTFRGKSGRYALWLCATSVFQTRKEGEITIALRDLESEQILARLTFLLAAVEPARPGMMIGGLQGPKQADAKELIVSATRDLYGLRPRDAVLTAALAIANSIGAREVWAVPSSMHVHNTREKRLQKRLFVDYDEVWAERGARRAWPFGWLFAVPAATPRSGKTANGRRRDEVKDAIWTLARSGFTGEASDWPQIFGQTG